MDSLQTLAIGSGLAWASGVRLYGVVFFADKIPGLDSVWDALHTFIRVPAGALLAAASLGINADPALVLAAGLAGGTLAGTAHFAKAGTRALINTSPEPFSNWTASFGEEITVAGAMWLAFTHPLLFLPALGLVLVLSIWLIARLWRFMARLFRKHALHPAGP